MSGIDKLEERSNVKSGKSKGHTARQSNGPLSEGVLITGMHRSGTSMVAALVQKLGVSQLGRKPMKPAADNPDGFWEDSEIMEISDDLLAASGYSWRNLGGEMTSKASKVNETLIATARNDVYQLRQDVGEPWFIKDPRICLLFDEWRRILLLRAPVIVIVRDPHEVASSLMQRDFIAQEEALALWYRYNHSLLNSLKNVKNLVLDYGATCIGPKSAQTAIVSFLERSISRDRSNSFKVTNQVIFNPRKTQSSDEIVNTRLRQESEDCLDLYASLRSLHLQEISGDLHLGPEPVWVRDSLDRAHAASEIRIKLADVETKAKYLFDELAASQGVLSERDLELARVQSETDKERTVLEAQLADVETKAKYLFDELAVSRGVLSERDLELARVQSETDKERTVLEAQLADVEAKAKYLFDELAVSRGVLSERELELARVQSETDKERTVLEAQLADVETKAKYLFDELAASRGVLSERELELARVQSETDKERTVLEAQLADVETKAEFLFDELAASRGLLSDRDLELSRVQSETDIERTVLEGQLAEVEAKAEFLFDELAASRGLLSDRDLELSRVQSETDIERTVLESQLADVETKAKYLSDELAASRGLLSDRDLELSRVQSETDIERTVLEGQLAEVETKAEFLFAELAASRGLLTDRDLLVDLLQRQLRTADLELTRLAVNHTSLEFEIKALKKVDAERVILEDVSLYLLEDLRRLTSKRTYRISRKFKIFVRKLLTFNSDQISLRNDVIPTREVDLNYLGRILELQLHSAEYLELYPDIEKSGVNPYSHYLKKGESEGRVTPRTPIDNR